LGTGAEYEQLLDRLVGDLKAMRDPRDGGEVARNVFKRALGSVLQRGRRSPGGVRDGIPDIVADGAGRDASTTDRTQPEKWSGDHGSYDYATTAGILVTNIKTASAPRMIDIGPTVLKFFGVAIPPDVDGRPLY
jgi:predicted AlkP superfamily phosphohydrolase/phosphomutase